MPDIIRSTLYEDAKMRTLAVLVLSTVALERTSWRVALSILDMLHVPEGWCSSGRRANEYTLIPVSGARVCVGKAVRGRSRYHARRICLGRCWSLAVTTGFSPSSACQERSQQARRFQHRIHQAEAPEFPKPPLDGAPVVASAVASRALGFEEFVVDECVAIYSSSNRVLTTECHDAVRESINSIGVVERLSTESLEEGLAVLKEAQ